MAVAPKSNDVLKSISWKVLAMNHADDVREYCKSRYVVPARQKRERSVTIRAGDVHRALNHRNRYPLVCAAIGSNLFEELAGIRRVSIEGPLNGANTLFKFELL
jgi:5-methylcytosine-specific restriction enzyme B